MTGRKEHAYIPTLKKRFAEGKIDRRRFMERALALGLTIPAASALWSSTTFAATPKRGGTFRVGVHDGNTTDSLDPATTLSIYMIELNHCIRNWLTEITEENVVGPELAESWAASDDATIWTFKLRKGVEFHNGKPFTAEDVVDSLNYHRGEDTKSPGKALLESIEEIRADDKYTVTIKLAIGNADLPYVLTDYHLVMMQSDGNGGVDTTSGIGTGGYVLGSHDPGVRTKCKRFANYWKEGRAHFDALDFTAINDPAALQSALITDDVDAVSQLDLKTVSLLKRDPNIRVVEVPSGSHCTIPMFTDVAPFDNLDVRLALKYAIDREAILDKVQHGHGVVGNDHPIGPTLPYWADLPQRKYDPDKARFHLKKAGMEGLTVSLSSADAAFAGAVDLAVVYSESAKASGITINIVREPNDGYWSNVWLKKPFVVASWGARPTPDVIFSLAYSADAKWNEAHWKNERFNKLLLVARAELDNNKRADMYRDMQMIVRDDGGTIVPFFRNYVYAHRKNVMHSDKLSGNWQLDGARAFERWWFA